MKLLVWSPFYTPDAGGIETLLANLLPRYLQRGNGNHECCVICSSNDPHSVGETVVIDGVQVHRFDFHNAINSKNIKQIASYCRNIAGIKNQFGADICHVHGLYAYIFFIRKTADAGNAPVVVTLHNDYTSAGIPDSLDSSSDLLIKDAAYVTGVSQAALDSMREPLARHKKPSRVIYNGIDLSLRKRSVANPAQHQIHLVTVARLVPVKGIDVLLEAFSGASSVFPNAKLSIAGNGYLLESLQTQAQRLGIAEKVDFLGQIESDEVNQLLSTATLFVLPSRYEGLPICCLEASAAGVPIVATRVGGTPEIVIDGVTGNLVEKDDPANLTETLIKLLSDRELLKTLGDNGRQFVADNFSLDSCLDQYIEIYQTVLDGKIE